MLIFRYVIEIIITFFVVWGFNFFLNYLLKKKNNPLVSSIITFIIIGFSGFLLAPYVIAFPYYSFVYMPIALGFFLFTSIKILKA
jgi:hypothetical protein